MATALVYLLSLVFPSVPVAVRRASFETPAAVLMGLLQVRADHDPGPCGIDI